MFRGSVKSGPGPLAYGLIAGIVALGFATGIVTVVAVNAATGHPELTGTVSRAAAKRDREPLAAARMRPVLAVAEPAGVVTGAR